jgi:hypothetical protein
MGEASSLRLDRFCVKLYARDARAIDFDAAIPVFHRWIQERRIGGLWIDVADYRHVPDGPGVLLVGHEADCALDQSEGPAGLLYNRKRLAHGSNVERLGEALRAALVACRALEQEPELARRGLAFDGARLRLIVNDRLAAPNVEETMTSLRPDIEALLARVYPGVASRIERDVADRRDRFSVEVAAASARPIPVAELLERWS